MDEGATRGLARRRATTRLFIVLVACASGCTTYVGTTARSFLKHVKSNPDPNVRYVAYSKLGSRDLYDDDQQKGEAVATLIDRYQNGKEPVAIRAVICRTLGELGDPSARGLLLQAVHHEEAVIKIEACRALGKVGQSEDATVLAQVMTLDHLEDARIAAIEGLADVKSRDPRIYKVLLDGMEHDDPAIRLASLNALRKLTDKDEGTDVAAWRRLVEPLMAAGAPDPAEAAVADAAARAKSSAAATDKPSAAPPPRIDPDAHPALKR